MHSVKGRPHYYSTKKEEYAHIKFDLEADLSSLFTWNTKQVFIYIVAVFPSSSSSSKSSAQFAQPYSEAIIWDAIIPSAIAPWHANTYIHPGTTKSAKKARDSKKLRSKGKKRGDTKSAVDEAKPYPPGTKEGIIRLENQKPKYQITTPSSKIAGLGNCTLYLRYNIQPWVGALVWSSWPPLEEGKTGFVTPMWEGMRGGKSDGFDMPLLKTLEASKAKEELGTETGGEANRGKPA